MGSRRDSRKANTRIRMAASYDVIWAMSPSRSRGCVQDPTKSWISVETWLLWTRGACGPLEADDLLVRLQNDLAIDQGDLVDVPS